MHMRQLKNQLVQYSLADIVHFYFIPFIICILHANFLSISKIAPSF